MRHMKIQIISAILIALITLSYMPLTLSASDYSAHFAKDAIDQLIAKGTVLPDSYGNVHPETYILRAEFVKVINREFGFTTKALTNFSDVDMGEWYAQDFLIAKGTGYLTGDGLHANPTVEITRAEVSVILARILGLFKTGEPNFKDNNEIPKWGLTAVNGLADAGIIHGYPDGAFLPNNKMTRGETFYLLNVIPKISVLTSDTSDLKNGNTISMSIEGAGSSSGSGGNRGNGNTGAPSNTDTTPRSNVINIDSNTGLLYYGISPNVTSYQVTVTYSGDSETIEFPINSSLKGSINLNSAINTLLGNNMDPEALLTVTVAVKGTTGDYIASTAQTYTFLKTFSSLDKPNNFNYSYQYTGTQKNAVFSWGSVAGAVGYEVTVQSGSEKKETSFLAQEGAMQTFAVEDLVNFENGTFLVTVKALANPVTSDKKNSKLMTQTYNKQGAFLEAGTINDPYIINDPVDLYNMINPAGVYYIVSNLTVSRPITSFTGRLEGRLNRKIGEKPTITLNISETNMERVALFSEVTDGNISNLILTGSVASAGSETTASTAAGLVGETFGVTNISGVINYANIVKSKNGSTSLSLGAGGIVGRTSVSGSVSSCQNYGTIEVTTITNSYSGGIVGHANSPIKNCINYGQVKGLSSVGGIAGATYSGISDCANYGAISAISSTSYVGGVIGTFSSSTLALEGCYNAGIVTGNANTAGIAGRCYPGVSARILNCFNVGAISSTGAKCGGIIGSVDRGTVELSLCYDAQSVSRTPYNIIGDNEASSTTGKIIADNETIFYLDDGNTNSGFNGTKISKRELQNLLDNTTKFSKNVWRILPETGYPYPQLNSNICNVKIRMDAGLNISTGEYGYLFSWDEMPGEGNYKLYMSLSEDYTENDLINSAIDSTSYFIFYKDLELGKTYYFTIQREELVSESKRIVADPFTNLNINVSKRIEGTVFTWDDVSGPELYKIYIGESKNFSDSDLMTETLINPTYTLSHEAQKELISGNTYYIRVSKGNVISEAVTYVPASTFDLRILVTRVDSDYTLTWDEVPGDGNYKLYIGSSSKLTESDLVSDAITDTSYVLSGSELMEEQSYFMKVVKGSVESQTIEYAPYLYSSNTLKSVTIGGKAYNDLDPEITSYRIVLPSGTDVVPEIGYEATSYRANVRVNAAAGLPGTTTVIVTSESGVENTYTFDFAVIKKATAVIKRAGQSNRTALTIRDITSNMTTFIQMRNYNNDMLSGNTYVGFLRFELEEAMPENSEIVSADLHANFAQTAGYVPTFSFYNAQTDWDGKVHPIPSSDTELLYSSTVLGSVSNTNWKPYSTGVTTADGTGGTVSLNDNLEITNGTTINLGVTVSNLDNTSRLGQIYFYTRLGLPTIDIYYIMEP